LFPYFPIAEAEVSAQPSAAVGALLHSGRATVPARRAASFGAAVAWVRWCRLLLRPVAILVRERMVKKNTVHVHLIAP
jgi:hypothetical protein